jgi:gliding motility-associated-like protein
MRIKALLFSLLIFSVKIVSAQLCTGSLGDAVVNIDFGSGTPTYGAALAAGVTNYTYRAQSFPNDGSYTIENTTAGAGNVWWSTTDHTGNTGGYMMVVNASTSLSDYFYKQTVSGLCENTTYEFASWIMNLLRSSDTNPPNVTFTIERTSGEILGTYTTGTIPKAASAVWKQFGFFFKTPAGVTDVVIRMKNNSPGGAPANDLALDDITFRPCGPDIQASIELTNSPTTLSICAGSTTDYKIVANVSSGYSNPNYQWQLNTNGTGWADITGATGLTTTVRQSAAGTYQYRLSVGEGAVLTNCRVVSGLVAITVKAPPAITASNNSPVCVGGVVSFGGTFGDEASYQWSGPKGIVSNDKTFAIANIGAEDAGLYTLTVTTAEGCTATASTTVIVGSRPVATVSANVQICEGTSTTLHASGGQAYLWLPAAGLSNNTIADPIANPSVTTTYTVTVRDNAYSCPSSASVVVGVLKSAVAGAGPDKTTIRGNPVQLEGRVAGDSISYYWTPSDYLSNANLLNPVALPEKTITYTLHVLSEAGCLSTQDEMTVTVHGKIEIPNTFSPNGDGVNDVWNIAALESYTKSTVSIFNRYGSPVYKSTGYAVPWNGTDNGAALPVGTYYYRIDLKNNTPLLSGWIWLTR